MTLNKRQKKILSGKAHHLKPFIQVGNAGITEALLKETEQTLEHHELLKIKLPAGDKSVRQAFIEQICSHCRAELIQTIGRTATIYRPAKTPSIVLPD